MLPHEFARSLVLVVDSSWSGRGSFVPTFFVTNLFDLEAPCIHKFCKSACFALPRPLRLSTSSLSCPDVGSIHIQCPGPSPRSEFPNPSDAVLTAAYSSLSAVDKHTTCCFLVHTFKQCHPLMITPADTDRWVTLSPPQSASQYDSRSPLCRQWNRHSARGFPTGYHPILLTGSRSDADGFAISQHTCLARKLEIWSIL